MAKEKRKIKKSKEEKKKIIDLFTIVERQFLRDIKLPNPMDKKGIQKVGVEFKNKFGATRFISLALSDRGLYNLAAKLQAEASRKPKKKKRIKATRRVKRETTNKKMPKGIKRHGYTAEEENWLKQYKLPKYNKKGLSRLARAFNKKFSTKVSGRALYWKAKNLLGEWNVKKRTAKKKLTRGGYARAQENFLLVQAEKLSLKELVEFYNNQFGENRTFQAIRIKLGKLRRKGKIAKKPSAMIAEVSSKVKVAPGKGRYKRYTKQQDNYLLIAEDSLKDIAKLTESFNHNFGEDRTLIAITNRLYVLKRKGMTADKVIDKAIRESKSTAIRLAVPVEYIVLDPDGDKVIWRSDHDPRVELHLMIDGKFVCSYGVKSVPRNLVVFKRT